MELIFDVLFWDGENVDTFEHVSLEKAWSENFIEIKDKKLIPTDEYTIIRMFTGLYDKNKKPIYEGDLVKLSKTKYIVEWSKILSGFCLINKDGEFYDNLRNRENLYYKYEIIGNKFENPGYKELLK